MPSIINRNRSAVVEKSGEGAGEDQITDGAEETSETETEEEDGSETPSA